MDPEQRKKLEAMLAMQEKESHSLMKELGLMDTGSDGDEDADMKELYKEMKRQGKFGTPIQIMESYSLIYVYREASNGQGRRYGTR